MKNRILIPLLFDCSGNQIYVGDTVISYLDSYFGQQYIIIHGFETYFKGTAYVQIYGSVINEYSSVDVNRLLDYIKRNDFNIYIRPNKQYKIANLFKRMLSII